MEKINQKKTGNAEISPAGVLAILAILSLLAVIVGLAFGAMAAPVIELITD